MPMVKPPGRTPDCPPGLVTQMSKILAGSVAGMVAVRVVELTHCVFSNAMSSRRTLGHSVGGGSVPVPSVPEMGGKTAMKKSSGC